MSLPNMMALSGLFDATKFYATYVSLEESSLVKP